MNILIHIFCIFFVFCTFTKNSIAQTSEAEGKSDCELGSHIFFLDRTSRMNDAEKRSFESGIAQLFSKSSLSGQVNFIEIRGSALAYKRIGETCLRSTFIPTANCMKYFETLEDRKARAEEELKFAQRALKLVRGLFVNDAEPTADAIRCETEKSNFFIAQRKLKDRVVESITRAGLEEIDDSPTALAGSVLEAARVSCSSSPCNLYLFSNLLDSGWKEIAKSSINLSSLGASVAQKSIDTPLMSRVAINSVLVWGFGFDEKNGESKQELNNIARNRILEYWMGFFSVLAADSDSVSIGFEVAQ